VHTEQHCSSDCNEHSVPQGFHRVPRICLLCFLPQTPFPLSTNRPTYSANAIAWLLNFLKEAPRASLAETNVGAVCCVYYVIGT
jgi:hypothetical protein